MHCRLWQATEELPLLQSDKREGRKLKEKEGKPKNHAKYFFKNLPLIGGIGRAPWGSTSW
jgi:hypothetical protein